MTRKEPDFEGCNHHLSAQAAIAAPKILRTHGNAKFNFCDRKIPKGIVNELLEQGYLRHGSEGQVYHTGKLVIGNPPKIKRKAV